MYLTDTLRMVPSLPPFVLHHGPTCNMHIHPGAGMHGAAVGEGLWLREHASHLEVQRPVSALTMAAGNKL